MDSWPRGRSLDGGVDRVPLPGGGELWLCGKHAIGRAVETVLASTGASTVVCLTERHELADRYPDYVEWLDRHRGGRAIWFPIHDLHAPTLDAALVLLVDLCARVEAGERLLVHCAAGFGRSGTIAACLLVLLGVPVDEALEHVAAHRPMAGPEVGAQRELVAAVAARAR